MLADGVYRVIFSQGEYGPAEEITCLAYNNRSDFGLDNRGYRYLSAYNFYNYADFLRSCNSAAGCSFNPAHWSWLVSVLDGVGDFHNFLSHGFAISANTIYDPEPGSVYAGTGLGAIDQDPNYSKQSYDAEGLFGFTNPSGSGTIVNISVYAFVIGIAKTKFRAPNGTTTYGTQETKTDIYQWIHTDHIQAWNWSDINNIKAGVWLKCNSGKCRSIKLRITCSDGSTVDVFPSSTYSSSYLRRVFANPFMDPSQDRLYYEADLYGRAVSRFSAPAFRRYSSDFSEFPPNGSDINFIKVEYSYCGKDKYYEDCIYSAQGVRYDYYGKSDYGGCTIRPFLFIDGAYYYGTSYGIGNSLDSLTDHEYTWETNPATGLPWGFHDAHITYGVEVNRPANAYAIIRIYKLSATTNFYPLEANVGPTYSILPIIRDSEELIQRFQSPIQADDLTFRLPGGQWIAEREEIALIKDGAIVWRGIVWTVEENENHSEVIVHAKSQQVALDYRSFPGISYVPSNKEFIDIVNIDDILSDDAPKYPCWTYVRGDEDRPRGSNNYDNDWPVALFDVFSVRKGVNNTTVGLFFFLNSYLFGDDSKDVSSSAIYGMDLAPQHEDTDTWSIEGCTWGWNGYKVYYPAPSHIVTPAEIKGGVSRLAWRSDPVNVARGEFAISDGQLITENSGLILADHAVDTHLRPGANDLGNYWLHVEYNWKGTAATCFSDFFDRLGQEVRYRYEWDGLVYQDAAIAIANGSEATPLARFVDGKQNCIIRKTVPSTPNPDAAIGLGTNPKVSCDWAKPPAAWLSQICRSAFAGGELEDYLARHIDANDATYEIDVLAEYWHLRPGDWISVDVAGDGPRSVRIRQITTMAGKTAITAGKRLRNLDEQFGIWRLAGSSESNRTVIRTNAIAESTTLATSTTFAVSAQDLAFGGWQCKLSLSWGFVLKWVLYGASKIDAEYDTINSNTPPYPINAYVQISGQTYTEYGPHEYEFFITRNMQAVGVEPYGENDVAVLTTGKFKWRKDGGAWSEELEGYDVWHQSSNYNADLGNGLWGRVIFSYPISQPQMTPVYTDILSKIGYAWACNTIDLSDLHKFIIIKIGGKVIPPGRFAAVKSDGSLDVDITEFCNVAGSYTLTTQLVGGIAKSTNPQYYHTLSGSIEQSKYAVPLEAE